MIFQGEGGPDHLSPPLDLPMNDIVFFYKTVWDLAESQIYNMTYGLLVQGFR